MTVATGALVVMVVLAAAGALPVVALVGLRVLAVPLLPLGGAVIAAVAAAGMVAVGGSLLPWFVALAALGAVVVAAVWILRPAARPFGRQGRGPPVPVAHRLTGLVAVVALSMASAWSLVALRTPSVGFDARTIWMLHARWYVQGHTTSLAALRNTALPFAHAGYPPLIGGTVALAWLVTGLHSDRFGVVVVSLLNASAVMAAAWLVVDLGRRGARVVGETRRRLPPGAVRAGGGIVPSVAGVAVAVLLVLVAFGVAGPFATNGYADMLWAAGAVGAVGCGLVLGGRRFDLGAAAVLLAVAGLTKNEGYVTSMAIVALLALRGAFSSPVGETGRRWRAVLSGVAGVIALGLWPLLIRLLHAAPNAAAPGRRDGDDASRLHAGVVSMAGHLHVLILAAAVSVVGTVLLGRARRAMGLGSDGWTWAALAAGLGAVLVAYVAGPGNIELWLLTSTHRTTIYGALLGWWVVGFWAVIGATDGVRPRRRPSGTSPRST